MGIVLDFGLFGVVEYVSLMNTAKGGGGKLEIVRFEGDAP